MADFKEFTIQALVNGLQGGDFSSYELTSYFLERIQALEENIHAFLSLKEDYALEQAKRADELCVKWRAKKFPAVPPLLGLPIAVKDVLCVEGFP